MSAGSGVTSVGSSSYDELKAGDVEVFSVLLGVSQGALAVGQVLEFNTTTNDFVAYTSGSAANAYAVLGEAAADSASQQRVLAIVRGDVRKDKLDATAQADAEIEGALLGSGIRPLTAYS